MKDILILGEPRSGKTTLSIMLSNELKNYHIISLDCVRDTFNEIFPQLEIKPGSKNNFTKLPKFVSKMIYYNKMNLKENFNYIIEGAQIMPDIAKELFDDSIIIFLGHGNLQPQEILNNIRKYDTPDQYSYERDDEAMLRQIIKDTKKFFDVQEKCKLYGFTYIDTSFNRKEKLNDIVKYILKNIDG